MRKIVLSAALSVLGIVFSAAVAARAQAGAVTLELTDARAAVTRAIDKNLVLRIRKDSSATQKDFGWLVEVVRRPARRASRNLIYTNPAGITADRSQVMAWMVGGAEFPNVRRLPVKGYPLTVTIELLDPRAEGRESDARFVAGRLRVSWRKD